MRLRQGIWWLVIVGMIAAVGWGVAWGLGRLTSSTEAEQRVREISARTARYHELNDRAKRAGGEVQEFLQHELKVCQAQGQGQGKSMVLQMDQSGDLVCVEQPKAPVPAPTPAPTK